MMEKKKTNYRENEKEVISKKFQNYNFRIGAIKEKKY